MNIKSSSWWKRITCHNHKEIIKSADSNYFTKWVPMPAQEDDRCRAFLHQCINLANIQVSRAYCIITERIYEMSLKVPVINEFLVQFTQIVVPMDMTFTRMLECVRNQARKKKRKKRNQACMWSVSLRQEMHSWNHVWPQRYKQNP